MKCQPTPGHSNGSACATLTFPQYHGASGQYLECRQHCFTVCSHRNMVGLPYLFCGNMTTLSHSLKFRWQFHSLCDAWSCCQSILTPVTPYSIKIFHNSLSICWTHVCMYLFARCVFVLNMYISKVTKVMVVHQSISENKKTGLQCKSFSWNGESDIDCKTIDYPFHTAACQKETKFCN